MSRGQKPRWPEFYPHMKRRGRGRRRRPRVVFWNTNPFRPIWPPVIRIGDRNIRFDQVTVTVTSGHGTRQLNRVSGYWESTEEA